VLLGKIFVLEVDTVPAAAPAFDDSFGGLKRFAYL
jgi:hypothetical protein